nr:putative reverse transcriptase domain-containing protein [Tanacetum cinerariifolium]
MLLSIISFGYFAFWELLRDSRSFMSFRFYFNIIVRIPDFKCRIPSSYFVVRRSYLPIRRLDVYWLFGSAAFGYWNKVVIVCHEKVVRISLEGDEILLVQGELTQGVVKTLLNTQKVRVKLRRVRAMSVTIQSSVKDKILATPIDTSKVENMPAEMLYDLDQQMEKRADDESKIDEAHASRYLVHLGADKSKEWNSGDDQTQSEMDDLPRGLADAAESVRDAIGFELHVLWSEIGESSLTGLELVQETTDKVVLVKEKPKAARDRQKSYVDYRCKPLEFEGKLAPRYVEPFEILERIGSIACGLRLPEELSSVHDTFHMSHLKKSLANANLHVPLDEVEADKTLHFVEETVGIMDREI